jgi:hypothetical protein
VCPTLGGDSESDWTKGEDSYAVFGEDLDGCTEVERDMPIHALESMKEEP